jgi:hypothetical protein
VSRIRSLPSSLSILFGLIAIGWAIVPPVPSDPLGFAARETTRLRLHFDSVEAELLGRDVSSLTPAQRGARADQIRLLHEYAARGAFPRNDDFPGRWVPYFRDRHGNLCAMAFLIAASGRGDIVDHVARTRNNAYLPDLVDEPGLADWLSDHGLTVAEAARIQPKYGGGDVVIGRDKVSSEYAALTGVSSVLAGTSVVLNLRSLDEVTRYRGRGLLGLAAGGFAIGLGVSKLGDYASPGDAMGVWSIGVGSVALILGARSVFWKRPATAAAPRSASRLEILPVVLSGGASRVGLSARVRL